MVGMVGQGRARTVMQEGGLEGLRAIVEFKLDRGRAWGRRTGRRMRGQSVK